MLSVQWHCHTLRLPRLKTDFLEPFQFFWRASYAGSGSRHVHLRDFRPRALPAICDVEGYQVLGA